jgi:hypothetical protein
MLSLGLADLPDSPDGIANMPTPSQQARFGMGAGAPQGGLNDPAPAYDDGSVSGPQEVREAVFDAGCRESTGYSQTLYDTELAAEQGLINHNGTKLDQALLLFRELDRVTADIIKQHGR